MPGFLGFIADPLPSPYRALSEGSLRHRALSPLIRFDDAPGTLYAVYRRGANNVALKVWPDGSALYLGERRIKLPEELDIIEVDPPKE